MLYIETITVTPFQQNARLLIDGSSGVGAIVDPGGDIPYILDRMSHHNALFRSILLTHAHIDHAGGVAELIEKYRPAENQMLKVYAHPADRQLREAIETQASFYGLPSEEFRVCPEPDIALNDGDVFSIGNIAAKVLFTPGHAPGHIVLYYDTQPLVFFEGNTESRVTAPLLIAGDLVFHGSVGRTDLPLCDPAALIASIRTKVLPLPGETIIAPGHGPMTTLGRERHDNPFLAEPFLAEIAQQKWKGAQ